MSPQQTIAHYRLGVKLGEGGMGAVYRATDTKLNREVAVKVLPEAFAADPDRMTRFAREAQVLASLNHPNIAAIYGVEERALVMELVEGEDLRGPVALDTALDYARQIAAGLEAAHEKGIVHRDLKPANIKVTPDGTVKLLDFGLAKAEPQSNSAATATMTLAGAIMGTAAYMSPEQARGKPVDKRADIWAFGVVLYELLTGATLFGGGETVSDALAAVITREPDLSVAPGRVRPLLQACLEKDPRQRLRDIGDWRRLIVDSSPAPGSSTPARPVRRWPWMAALAGVAVAAGAGAWMLKSPPDAPLMQFEIVPPEGVSMGAPNFSQLALAPDGRAVLFVARDADGKTKLWLRRFEAPAAAALSGTDGALDPAWAPDGRSIAFRSANKLLAMDLAGGPPRILGEHGATPVWGRDGSILGVQPGGMLGRYPAAGGAPVAATKRDPSEKGQIWASYFPDNARFLYDSSGPDGAVMRVAHPDGSVGPPLDTGGRTGRLAFDGLGRVWLVAARGAEGQLEAIRFNTPREALEGAWRPLASPLPRGPSWSASDNGVLAFRRLQKQTHHLAWLDRAGRPEPAAVEVAAAATVSISPDGKRAALVREYSGDTGIWLLDLSTRLLTRLSLGKSDVSPVWSADGAKLYYLSRRGMDYLVVERVVDGAADERTIVSDRQPYYPECLSPDGRYLLLTVTTAAFGDLLVVPVTGGQPARRLQSQNWNVSLSPDGRWMVFQTPQDIFVSALSKEAGGSGTPGKWQISTGGGTQPVWRGKEIFYVAPGGKLMAVPVETGDGVRAGTPVALFDTRMDGSAFARLRQYDVAPDGKHFLVREDVNAGPESPISVVMRWEKLLP